MEKKIKVVICEPGKQARVAEIENTLEAMQEIVGGYIEAVYAKHGNALLIMNEDGKMHGLPLNRGIYEGDELLDIICGTFFVTSYNDEGDFESLNDRQTAEWLKQYRWPETFTILGDRIISQEVRHA